MDKVLKALKEGLIIQVGEINKDRLQHAINTLEMVKQANGKFDHTCWYSMDVTGAPACTALLECGTSACILGWVAATPEWKEAGGSTRVGSFSLIPTLPSVTNPLMINTGMHAMQEWLGCSELVASLIVLRSICSADGYFDICPELKELTDEMLAGDLHPVTASDIWDDLEPTAYSNPDNVTIEDALALLYQIRDQGTIRIRFRSSDSESLIQTEEEYIEWLDAWK